MMWNEAAPMSDKPSPTHPRLPQAPKPTARELRMVDEAIERLTATRAAVVPDDAVEEINELDILIEDKANVIAEARGQASTEGLAFRRSARFLVAASLLLEHDGKRARLSLINLSATGALIAYDVDGPRMRVGALLFLTLLPDDPERSVELNARVVREQGRGTAVDWSGDAASVDAVAELLRTLGALEEA
jgi:hypothetical protein